MPGNGKGPLERGPTLAPIRVLLVNDFPVVAWGLEQLLNSRQPAITVVGTAATAAAALRDVGRSAPDLILVDIDGEHGADTIRKLLAACRARVLALTGSRDSGVLDAAVLAGASGVIGKGEPVELLLKAIERVHAGEIWVDRVAAGRIFVELARRRAQQEQSPEQARIARLTRKELRVAAEVARDASAVGRDIARRLYISEHTLRNHLTKIYDKLEVANRTELYAYANRHGIGDA